MANAVPKIRVINPQNKDSAPQSASSTQSPVWEGLEAGRFIRPQMKGDRPLSSGKSSPTKLRGFPGSPSSQSNGPAARNGRFEGQTKSDAAIDPLSQHILKRTHTTATLPQKLRSPTEIGSSPSASQAGESFSDTKQPTDTSREITSWPTKDKKKGVSFLSRFIGNKRKGTLDGAAEDESEAGDSRPEGMEAQLFSQPIDNLGFSPRHPQPPAYIKVRARFKKEKEFNRVFLAQGLRSRSAPAEKKKPQNGANAPPTPSGSAATNDPTWALEFSKDGKYLAAGGQDKIVRVWAVISTPEERRAHEREEAQEEAAEDRPLHLSAPVFQKNTFREYQGHTATILDLSWSKNNFLLSSSMDKTVRLWHVSRSECLCTFKHTDFVPSIQFHPRDDRFFLAGSLDTKLRLWSIPDKSVAFWNQLPDMITSVAFTPDGKTCIAGTLTGLCMFYETEGLKYQTQIHVKSNHGKNAKGSKITGIQTINFPPGSSNGEVKLLISSNDSRIRLYNFRDKSLEVKFKGHENNYSQIRASFADDAGYVVCGSEDRKAYMWSTGPAEGEKRNQRPMETFEAHTSITTCSILAPIRTRQLLSNSEDPVYELCNPPPVTLISRTESINSSRAPTEAGSTQTTPGPTEPAFKRVEESPAYIARSAHPGGNIIVTADYTGSIKVFRQDCAYQKRLRTNDAWETSSVFSKKISPPGALSRPSSIATRTSGRTRRDSNSTQPPSDRILSWRQDIAKTGSFDSGSGAGSGGRGKKTRSVSPRKSFGQMSLGSSSRVKFEPTGADATPPLLPYPSATTTTTTASPMTSLSLDPTPGDPSTVSTPPRPLTAPSAPASASEPNLPPVPARDTANPLWVQNGQSWVFWNTGAWREQMAQLVPPARPVLSTRPSNISSALSSEVEDDDDDDDENGGGGVGTEEDVKCRKCGGTVFKARVVRAAEGAEGKRLVCTRCGMPA